MIALRHVQASLLALTVALSAPVLVADTKVGAIDTQRAVMESEDGLRMQATLKKLFDKRQQEADKRQNELQRERADIDKQRGVLSQEALAKRAEKWQREAVQVQQLFAEYNRELQKKQNELTQPILQKTLGVVRRLATAEGYAMVVDKQAVPYVRKDLDLTDRVIRAYNNGGLGVAPEPAAAGATNNKGARAKP